MASTDLSELPDRLLPDDSLVVKQEHGDIDLSVESPPSSPRRSKKKRDSSVLRKAPQAPKRFKSSYICFFMAKQPVIKEELGDKATVTDISKRSAEMWRNLPPDERAHWDDVAAKDKQRYMVEKASYTGPWQVPWKRAKKDPSAPKRPMSAFLYFSQGRRRQIKEENPHMKNTEVSRLLGEMWRGASEEERRPHVEKEKHEREKYKIAIANWRKDFDAKKEEQRKQQAQQPSNPQWSPQYSQEGGESTSPQTQYAQPPYMPAPPSYPPYPSYSYAPAYPPAPSGYYQYPVSGKQPVILGPNGMPHYGPPAAASSQPPPVPFHHQQQTPGNVYSPQHQHQTPLPPPHTYDEPHQTQGPAVPTTYDYVPDHIPPEPQTAE